MGAGPLTSTADRAWAFLQAHPVWQTPSTSVHFVGHSAGGLVARLLLARPDLPPGRVRSLLTISTPHQGTRLADLVLNLRRQHPSTYWGLRGVGYDVNTRREFFAEFTPQGVSELLERHPQTRLENLRTERVGSLVCTAPRDEWCWPLKAAHRLPGFASLSEPTDGMIERDSQPFGEVVGEIRLDHFRQLGLFGGSPGFQTLCSSIRDFIVTT